MELKFFSIPARDPGAFGEELNRFLRGHRVLAIHRELVTESGGAWWAVCVEFLAAVPGSASPNGGGKGKIDYKEVLSPEDFAVFSDLRDIRKELAERDGVPVYAVCTNEQIGVVAMDGPASGSNRVLRGGNWNNNASNCRAANRNNNSPGNTNNNNGFRTVRSSEGAPQRAQRSDPAAIPPAPPRAAWQNETTRPVPVGTVDAAPKAPGGWVQIRTRS